MFTSRGRSPGYLTHFAPQKLFAVLLLAALLHGCADVTTRPAVEPIADVPTQARQAMEAGNYGRAHALYQQLADTAAPPEAWHYRIEAASALYHNGLHNQALLQLEALPRHELPLAQAFTVQLLEARIHLQRDPDHALSLLLHPRASDQQLPDHPALHAEYHLLRAKAFERLNNHLQSAREYLVREFYLSEAEAIAANQQALWQALTMLSSPALRDSRVQPPPDAMSGWLELAELARDFHITPDQLAQRLRQWREHYPGHPATAAFLDGLQERSTEMRSRPGDIAVLLPLSGRLAAAGQAVQEGILTAWFDDPKRSDTRLHFIDVSDQAEHIHRHYQRAVELGAEFVIGPLDRSAVESLSLIENLALPTLALNQSEFAISPQLFQFGLNPEQEAREVARQAWAMGHRQAGMLVAQNPLGDRLGEAFKQSWLALGGQINGEHRYNPNENDFAGPIKGLLNISDSELRHRRINRLSQHQVSFTPRVREDMDFIFLVGQPRQARLIRPQLRFHHAGNMPVLSTSHVFTGQLDPDADRDMNGIYFVDTPWTLSATSLTSEIREYNREALASHRGPLQRLVAMGVDAYQLLPMLEMLRGRPYEFYPGETGLLSIDTLGRVDRQLQWARFQRGVPSLLQDSREDDELIQPFTP